MTERAKPKPKSPRRKRPTTNETKPAWRVERGARALRRHLKERLFDLRKVDFADFQNWLRQQMTYWNRHAGFAARGALRELRRQHPRVVELEKRVEQLRRAFQSSRSFQQFESLERQRHDAQRAIDGITLALAKCDPEKKTSLSKKLRDFTRSQQDIESQLKKLKRDHKEKAALEQAETELQNLLEKSGIAAAEVELQSLLTQQGRRSGQSGTSFEDISRQIVEQHIVPDLLRSTTSASARRRIHVLSGVTLGCARAEIDQMVVRLPRRAPTGNETLAVEVLAVVEAKRNINDLDIGFRHRQENLAWFTGLRDHYDPSAYRTGRYTDGHFTGTATHYENGEEFVFDQNSFRRFQPDPATGYFLNRLYFITTASWLHGMSSDEMSRLQHRVATDVDFDLNDEAYLRRLWQWTRNLPTAFEGPDVFAVFTSNPKCRRNIFLVGA